MKVWLVLPDPFSSRLFFDTGIVDGLRARLGDELELFLLDVGEDAPAWAERAGASAVTRPDDLRGTSSLPEKAFRRGDAWLDRRVGFYPLSLRHSVRHGFNRERMHAGHQNWFLDPTLAGPVPEKWPLDGAMLRWHYGRLRYVPPALSRRLRDERPAVVLANIQMHAVVPYVVGARRLGLPVVGHVASWDHTVGKGIVAPGLRRYIVQNDVMRDDLVRYHGIDEARVVVTGWPQTDVFYRPRPRAEYDALLRRLGLDPGCRVVLAMGNTPTNAPYEARFVERLVGWWRDSAADFSLLFRPHPRDRDWRVRFAAAIAADGVGVQEPSFTDLETLAVLLQHGDCVVANAGTILLDALVNDRPAVCVLYDEGAPAGESFALKNVSGEHYKALIESEAFYRADTFDDVASGIERSLERPDELRAERARVAREVVGEVDGRAAERVVAAILDEVMPVE
jgi:CDP-Glycerol:Poly(glycerophosphate) glycerophosphotransferase